MITHIKNSSEIKEFILQTSEAERRRMRAIHTVGLDAPGEAEYGNQEDWQ